MMQLIAQANDAATILQRHQRGRIAPKSAATNAAAEATATAKAAAKAAAKVAAEAAKAEAVVAAHAAMDELKASMRASQSRVIDLFRSLDADNDGAVDASELRAKMKSLHIDPLNDQAMSELFATFDSDGSARISYAELNRMLRRGAAEDIAPLAPALQPGAAGEIVLSSRNLVNLRSADGAPPDVQADGKDKVKDEDLLA